MRSLPALPFWLGMVIYACKENDVPSKLKVRALRAFGLNQEKPAEYIFNGLKLVGLTGGFLETKLLVPVSDEY